MWKLKVISASAFRTALVGLASRSLSLCEESVSLRLANKTMRIDWRRSKFLRHTRRSCFKRVSLFVIQCEVVEPKHSYQLHQPTRDALAGWLEMGEHSVSFCIKDSMIVYTQPIMMFLKKAKWSFGKLINFTLIVLLRHLPLPRAEKYYQKCDTVYDPIVNWMLTEKRMNSMKKKASTHCHWDRQQQQYWHN
jgi:hypothetical protein